MKIIWRKSMSTNYIFVGQQVCKQAHTHFVSSSISRLPSTMSLRTVALRNMSTTRLYRYYRGKTNSYCRENLYLYIANDKISPILMVYTHCQHTFQFKQLVKVHVALDDPLKQIHVVVFLPLLRQKVHEEGFEPSPEAWFNESSFMHST